jgi:hypothetical protein
MTVVGTKPVPVTLITAGELVPASSLVGETEMIVGAGLFTTKLTGVTGPLLKDPLSTTTARFPPLVSCAAGIVAIN